MPSGPPTPVTFEKHILSKEFYSEGANIGDFNHDGKMDIVSGPYWYEGPDFKTKHEYFPAKPFDVLHYSDAFFAFVGDFNHDGWDDILIIGFPDGDASWFENPQGKDGPWKKHLAFAHVDDESPTYTDITGDGQKKLVCISNNQLGYAVPDKNDPDAAWTFHPCSTKEKKFHQFTHGLGVGDMNGDGRKDLLEASGWWEQPASLDGDPVWAYHAFTFGPGLGGQRVRWISTATAKRMSSRRLQRINTAWRGLSRWRTAALPSTQFLEINLPRTIRKAFALPKCTRSCGCRYERRRAGGYRQRVNAGMHPPPLDPEWDKPAVLYWFEQHKTDDGKIEFIPHLIDDDSGVGTQVVVGDVNGDGMPDIVVGNKKGTFVFIQQRK